MKAARRPEVASPVVLLTADGGRFDGRVIASGEDVTVTVHQASYAKALLSAGTDLPGPAITLQWVTATGVYESPVIAAGTPQRAEVMLALHGEVTQSQRRTYVRVPVDLDAELFVGGPAIRVKVTDLSESGARLYASGGALVVGGASTLRLRLPEGPLDLAVRMARDAERASVLAVSFIELHERSATAIRRALFARQRELRAAGRL